MDYPEQRSDLGDGQHGEGARYGGLFHDGRGWGVRNAMRKNVIIIIIGTFATEIKRSGEKTQKNRVPRPAVCKLRPRSCPDKFANGTLRGYFKQTPNFHSTSDMATTRRKSSYRRTTTTYRRRTPSIQSLLKQLFRAVLRLLKQNNKRK